MNRPNLHRGHCFDCGAQTCGSAHVCPDPVNRFPQPRPKPFVRRWDPIAALWVLCIVENGKAWCPKSGTYTEVSAAEVEVEP